MKKFMCPLCGKIFSRKNKDIKMHMTKKGYETYCDKNSTTTYAKVFYPKFVSKHE